MDRLLQIINNILINKDEMPIEKLTSEMSLRDNIGLDSLDLSELTAVVEADFGVDIFESGVVNTIGEILEKLDLKVKS